MYMSECLPIFLFSFLCSFKMTSRISYSTAQKESLETRLIYVGCNYQFESAYIRTSAMYLNPIPS